VEVRERNPVDPEQKARLLRRVPPRKAYSLLKRVDYRHYRRLIQVGSIRTRFEIQDKGPGCYKAFTLEQERAWIHQAATAAELIPKTVTDEKLSLHPHKVQKATRSAFLSEMEASGLIPRSTVGGELPTSNSHLQKVEKRSPGLWNRLRMVIRDNTQERRDHEAV
jgi:hypothetical protein